MLPVNWELGAGRTCPQQPAEVALSVFGLCFDLYTNARKHTYMTAPYVVAAVVVYLGKSRGGEA